MIDAIRAIIGKEPKIYYYVGNENKKDYEHVKETNG